jgi:hypothetical protein
MPPLLFGVGRKNTTRRKRVSQSANPNKKGLPAICICDVDELKSNNQSTSTNNTSQTRSQRIAQLTRGYLGGTIQFGDVSTQPKSSFLGRTEGQPGGIGAPPLNRF